MKRLLHKRMKFLKNQNGLTLIELLVVIVILGIIAAIAIPMVINNKDKASENAAKQTNSIVKDAAARYEAMEGSAPGSIDVLAPNYIKATPECPEGYVAATTDFLTNYCQKDN